MPLTQQEARYKMTEIRRNLWDTNQTAHEAGIEKARQFLAENPSSVFAPDVKASLQEAEQRWGKREGIHNRPAEYAFLEKKYTQELGSKEAAQAKLKEQGWQVSTTSQPQVNIADYQKAQAEAQRQQRTGDYMTSAFGGYVVSGGKLYSKADYDKAFKSGEVQKRAAEITRVQRNVEEFNRVSQQSAEARAGFENFKTAVIGKKMEEISEQSAAARRGFEQFRERVITGKNIEVVGRKKDFVSSTLGAAAEIAAGAYYFGYEKVFSPAVKLVPKQIKEPIQSFSKGVVGLLGSFGKGVGESSYELQFGPVAREAGLKVDYSVSAMFGERPIYTPITEEEFEFEKEQRGEFGSFGAQIAPYFTAAALPYAAVSLANAPSKEVAYESLVGGAVLVGGLKGLGLAGGKLAGVAGTKFPKIEEGYKATSYFVEKYALPTAFGGIAVSSAVPIVASIEAGKFSLAREQTREFTASFGGYTLGGAVAGHVFNPYGSYLNVPREYRAEYKDLLKLKSEIAGQATLRKPLELEKIKDITPAQVREIKTLIVAEKSKITLGGSLQLGRAMVGETLMRPHDIDLYGNRIDLTGVSKSTQKMFDLNPTSLVESTQRTTLLPFEPTSSAFERIEIKGTGRASVPSGELSTPVKTKILGVLETNLKGVTGGTSAIKIQLGKGKFRAEGDIDYYVKSLSTAQKLKVISDVKLISGEKITVIDTPKQLKIRGESGKDIVNINIAHVPKSKVVAGVRVRPLEDLLSDKKAIARYSPKAEKALKAKADIKLIEAATTGAEITGVRAVKPYNIFARKIMGGFEKAYSKKLKKVIPMERYSKDIPSGTQFASDVLGQRKITAATNIPILKQYYQWKTGRGLERLTGYKDLLAVERAEPIANRQLAKVSLLKTEWFKETKTQEFLGTKGTIGSSGKSKIVFPEYNYKLPKKGLLAYFPISSKVKIPSASTSVMLDRIGAYPSLAVSKVPSASTYKVPSRTPSMPASLTVYNPPSKPPYTPPSRPPYSPPSNPPYTPPSRPPYTPPSRPPYYPPTRPPYKPPYTPPTLPGFKGEKQTAEDSQAYNALVYSKKRFVKVNESPLNREAALNEGAYYTDASTAARFRIKKVSGTPKRTDLALTYSAANKFRQSKSGDFIEKNKNRIDTSGEVRGIPLEGLLAQKRIKAARRAVDYINAPSGKLSKEEFEKFGFLNKKARRKANFAF